MPNNGYARYARDHDLPAEGENPIADSGEEEEEQGEWQPSAADYYNQIEALRAWEDENRDTD